MEKCRCAVCGNIFNPEDTKFVQEYRGEFWGSPAYETMGYSPCCMADIEEYTPITIVTVFEKRDGSWRVTNYDAGVLYETDSLQDAIDWVQSEEIPEWDICEWAD